MSNPKDIESDRKLAASFAEAWDDFVLAVRRAQARGQDSPDELTLAQYYLLLPLAQESALPLGQLAAAAGIAAPTATRIIDGLERCGVIRRERTESDRRAVLVSLTTNGQRTLRRKRQQLAHRRRRLYQRLEPSERKQAERLLRHLAQLISEL